MTRLTIEYNPYSEHSQFEHGNKGYLKIECGKTFNGEKSPIAPVGNKARLQVREVRYSVALETEDMPHMDLIKKLGKGATTITIEMGEEDPGESRRNSNANIITNGNYVKHISALSKYI